jgi:urea transport system permease protein
MGTGQLVLLQLLNIAVLIGTLALVALGLAIIYGLMEVINLAHGEFVMFGAYGMVIANMAHLSPWLGLLIAPVMVGTLGFFVERGLIRFLYRRPFDALLATWGLSLVLIQAANLIFGPQARALATPIQGAVTLFGMPFAKYRLFVLGVSIVLVPAVLAVFRYGAFGLKTRAVFQDAEMAASVGIRTPRIYSMAFVIGAALAGFAGALIAPLVTVTPQMGASYLVQAFMTVIVGGVAALVGVVGGAGVIGGIQGVVSYFSSSVLAQVITLAVAIVVVRVRPNGVFSRK